MKKFEWQSIGFVLLSIALTVLTVIAPAEAKTAAEENCPSVDLRNDYSFLNSSPDQKDVGWCYSYSGADLVSEKLGHRVSSFDLALKISFARALDGNFDTHHLLLVYGANFGEVEDVVSEIGVCSADKFNSDHPLAVPALHEAEVLANLIQKGKRQKKLTDLEIQKLVFSHSQQLHYIFPTTNVWALTSYFQKIGTKDESPLITVVDQVCANHRYQAKIDLSYDESEKKLEIAKALLQARHIVEIGYFEKKLENLSVPLKDIKDERHASTIIGMRFNKPKNRCEFLIHNSYGDQARRFYDPKLRTQAFNGNIWIDENLAKEIIENIDWID